jgi:hypothetical protein
MSRYYAQALESGQEDGSIERFLSDPIYDYNEGVFMSIMKRKTMPEYNS